jgi:ribonuclease BN (tRNA processing enzyme)
VGQTASAAGVKLVVLSHIVSGAGGRGDAAYIDEVKKSFSGPVVVGKDLMEF